MDYFYHIDIYFKEVKISVCMNTILSTFDNLTYMLCMYERYHILNCPSYQATENSSDILVAFLKIVLENCSLHFVSINCTMRKLHVANRLVVTCSMFQN